MIVRHLNILVVDDEPDNLELANAVLLTAGHRIVTCVNGAEALARCREADFDIVLMDITMPIMDGLTATRALRSEAATARLPILFVTGSTSGADAREAADAGGDHFMHKPYRRKELLAGITETLRRRGVSA